MIAATPSVGFVTQESERTAAPRADRGTTSGSLTGSTSYCRANCSLADGNAQATWSRRS
jgi:hypothetical protein